jgi:hypothetical protein
MTRQRSGAVSDRSNGSQTTVGEKVSATCELATYVAISRQ